MRHLERAPCDTDSVSVGTSSVRPAKQKSWFLPWLIFGLGAGIAGTFLALGIREERKSSASHFEQSGADLANSIHTAWKEYEILSMWAHDSCHRLNEEGYNRTNSNDLNDILEMCTRREFRNIYEQITSISKGMYALQYAPRVEHDMRTEVQDASRAWLAKEHPDFYYVGFKAVEWTDKGPFSFPLPARDFYYPLHLMEPFEGNEAVFDTDIYYRHSELIDRVMTSWEPALSPPTLLAQDFEPDVYSVFLTHPGRETTVSHKKPHSFISAVVRIPDLLVAAAGETRRPMRVYVYDSTDSGIMAYLGAAQLRMNEGLLQATPIRKTEYEDISLGHNSHKYSTTIDVVDRQWTVVVAPLNGSDAPEVIFIVVGTVIIFSIFVILGITLRRHLKRIKSINKIQAEADKAESAQQQVLRERRLNEYLAHEVRNPLASAMAALGFVTEHTMEKVRDEETRQLLLDDAQVVDSSLNYINDLLRSMLDVQRAKSGQIKVNLAPTDVLHDVLDPAAAILCVRGARVDVLTECPPDLVVLTDQLRLKQIVLNLSINATKFVQTGYIKLKAEIVEGSVVLSIEDTGPGVPVEKRSALFESFQESLDLLNQGTGIGLSICFNLCQLMGATIGLDESYISGVPNCPGARFVVDLKRSPLEGFDYMAENVGESTMIGGARGLQQSALVRGISSLSADGDGRMNANFRRSDTVDTATTNESGTVDSGTALPPSMRVLLVEDESILRKLFIRTVRKLAPSWQVTEAGNGERALQLMNERDFDVVFTDQYMPCMERPLLGTEVTRRMRAMGFTGLICGLSANDLRQDFMDAGADSFILKPWQGKEMLKAELVKLFGMAATEDGAIDQKMEAYQADELC